MLTGNAAIEAVQAMMLAGNAGARFNGPNVLKALRNGRARLVIQGIRLWRGVPLRGSLARFRSTRRSRNHPATVQRLSGPPGSPGRPRQDDPEPGWLYVGDDVPFLNGWRNA